MSATADLEAGLTPEELIPGDLASLEALATNCRTVADQLAATYRGIQYIELTGADWTGGAAVAYFLLKDVDVTRFKRAADAFEDAEGALGDYVRCLRDSRGQAAVACESYESGKQRQAADIAACAPPPPPTSPFAPYDPYGLAAAAAMLDDARDAVERVAAAGAQALRDAAALSPQRPRTEVLPPMLVDDGPSLSDVLSSPWHLAHGFARGMGGALTSIGDWFMPSGAPQVGSGAEGERHAVDGMYESSDGALLLASTALLFEGPAGRVVGRWRLNSWVRKNVDEISSTVSRQAQARHVFGTGQWRARNQGSYFLSSDDAQRVLDAYRGRQVTVLGRTKNGGVLVRYDDVTGFNNNLGAGYAHQRTHVFFIKGTRKVSVVPTSPTAEADR